VLRLLDAFTKCISAGIPLLVLLLVALPSSANAQSDAKPNAKSDAKSDGDRWGFAGAFEFGIFAHTAKGNIDSTELTGPRVTGPGGGPPLPQFGDLSTSVVDPQASREEVQSMLMGGTLEVMTPELISEFGRPRLFMDVNVSGLITSEVGLARDADPDEMALPDPRSSGTPIGEGAIIGRGSKITVQNQMPQIHAGLGSAFSFEVAGERFKIKPSFVYSRLRYEIYGVTHRPVRLNNDAGLNLSLEDDYRLIILSEEQEEVYHGIGPAIELEYDTASRIGPFDVTLFIKAHASHLLGDLKTRFTQANSEYPDEIVRYKYSQDRWVYRASTGVRFRWMP
jgi:hypothetical protein